MKPEKLTKCLKVLGNVQDIIGIELMCAAQAIEYRRPLRSSKVNEDLLLNYRRLVPFIEDDRVLSYDIKKSNSFLFK